MGTQGARKFSAEFKTEAVHLWRSSGKPKTQIAQELGISDRTLGGWVNQVDIDEGKAQGITTDERNELRELRKENRRLTMEREILKRAEAFWVEESNG